MQRKTTTDHSALPTCNVNEQPIFIFVTYRDFSVVGYYRKATHTSATSILSFRSYTPEYNKILMLNKYHGLKTMK